MSVVKFDAIAELTPTNAGARQMFEAMLAHIPEDDGKVNNVNPERIFVSPLAWAYFSAYQTMMYTSYASAKVLAMGIETPTRYLIFKSQVQEVLKAALPHHAEYIDQHPVSACYYLADELEGIL